MTSEEFRTEVDTLMIEHPAAFEYMESIAGPAPTANLEGEQAARILDWLKVCILDYEIEHA